MMKTTITKDMEVINKITLKEEGHELIFLIKEIMVLTNSNFNMQLWELKDLHQDIKSLTKT